MSLRSPQSLSRHDFTFVIPAPAGIQVCLRPISLDTRFRASDSDLLSP